MRKTVVIYHKDCPSRDGLAAAWSAWKKFGEGAEYMPLHPSSPLPEHIHDSNVYTLDYCFTRPQAEDVLSRGNTLIIIDHHVTARDVLPLARESEFALDHSGATLAWRHFFPNEKPPALLLHIEDIDLWKFNLPFTREYIEVLKLEPQALKDFDRFVSDFEDGNFREKLSGLGSVLWKKTQIEVEKLVGNAEEIIFEGHKCLMVNSPVHTSEIGSALYAKMPPMAVVWSRRGKRIVVGLRSDGSVDVAAIAQKYGGGGHRPAAGFSFERGLDMPLPLLLYSKSA